jgi:hypothetical protein
MRESCEPNDLLHSKSSQMGDCCVFFGERLLFVDLHYHVVKSTSERKLLRFRGLVGTRPEPPVCCIR